MTTHNDTPQEKAWAGEFGDAYHQRAAGNEDANFNLFRHAFYRPMRLGRVIVPKTLLEIGAGTGANVRALYRLFPGVHITAIEINQEAREHLARGLPTPEIIPASVLEWIPDRRWDLVMTKGLLIHIQPEHLQEIYRKIYTASARWIMLAEYFSPRLEEIPYRGAKGLLWKGPHAYDMLDRFPDLRLVDYGFISSRDPIAAQDDLNWWILSKT